VRRRRRSVFDPKSGLSSPAPFSSPREEEEEERFRSQIKPLLPGTLLKPP
jgi:hypothetical protein